MLMFQKIIYRFQGILKLILKLLEKSLPNLILFMANVLISWT